MNVHALASVARRLNITRPLVCVDVETTGKVPGVDRVVQIGVQKALPGGDIVSEWSTFVDPQMPIPMEASHVHKITNAMVASAPTFAELAGRLAAGLSDVDFVGQNVGFDLRFFEAEFKRVGRPWSHAEARILDTHRIEQILSPRDLTTLVRKYLNEEIQDAHDALSDVRWTSAVLAAMLDTRGDALPQSIEALHALLFPRDPSWVDAVGKIVWRGGEACLGFSVHNGKSLRELVAVCRCQSRHVRGCTKGYLEWMLGADFPEDVKSIVRGALVGKFPVRAAAREAA